MTTRRDVLRLASLATAAGYTLSFPDKLSAADRSVNESMERTHSFHAEALAVRAESGSRLTQPISTQPALTIASEGGYLSENIFAFRRDGIISYKSAYNEVSGIGGSKSGRGWATTGTSVIVGLNIADVVTADRIVARITTEHPAIGYVPSVSFLGTHFENLRIVGQPVNLHLDLNMLGEQPEGDVAYLSQPEFLGGVSSQSNRLLSHTDAPSEALARYSGNKVAVDAGEEIEFSLAHKAEGSFQGKSFGHIIQVPGFGAVHLATVKLSQSDYESGTAKATTVRLTMVETQVNGITITSGTAITNGSSRP